MEEATRALASIADPRRDVQKAEGQETDGQDVGLMTSKGTFMAENIAVDGTQQVRGADDVKASGLWIQLTFRGQSPGQPLVLFAALRALSVLY